MWEPSQATLDMGFSVLCGGKGTAPGCAHYVGAQRYQAIMFAGCLSPSECPKCGLRNSEVNYFPACRTSYLTIASCFWSWWKTQPVPRQNPHIKPYCRARKYLRSDAQWVNVPNEVATDLVRESRSSVIVDLESYQQINGCYALPRMKVQEMLEVIDRCIEGIP